MSANVLELRDIEFSYPNRPKLFDLLALNVPKSGHVKCILGPSGVGKSTILQLIVGEIKPLRGCIEVRGSFLPIVQNSESTLLPWFNVRRNILWGINDQSKIDLSEIAQLLEISEIMERLVGKLSGGQQQRVVLARAMARRPDVLLLDEPLASLDLGSLKRILPRIRDYLLEHRISAFWITHNLSEALIIADSISVIGIGGLVKEFTLINHADRNSIALEIQQHLL